MARFPGRPLGTGQLLGDPPGRCNAAGATPRRTHPAAHNYPGPHPARELPPRPHPTTPVAAAGSPPAAGMAARRGRAAQPVSGLLRSSAALALMLIAALTSQPTSPRAPGISANLRSKPRVGVDGDGGVRAVPGVAGAGDPVAAASATGAARRLVRVPRSRRSQVPGILRRAGRGVPAGANAQQREGQGQGGADHRRAADRDHRAATRQAEGAPASRPQEAHAAGQGGVAAQQPDAHEGRGLEGHGRLEAGVPVPGHAALRPGDQARPSRLPVRRPAGLQRHGRAGGQGARAGRGDRRGRCRRHLVALAVDALGSRAAEG